MKINADITSMDLNGGRMTVEHQDQTALFSFSTFKKEDFGNNNEVFKHLNIFWSQQSQSFQTAVFACYKRCEDLFGDVISLDELTARLKEQIKLFVRPPSVRDHEEVGDEPSRAANSFGVQQNLPA